LVNRAIYKKLFNVAVTRSLEAFAMLLGGAANEKPWPGAVAKAFHRNIEGH
jgi:hypothetical protein